MSARPEATDESEDAVESATGVTANTGAVVACELALDGVVFENAGNCGVGVGRRP